MPESPRPTPAAPLPSTADPARLDAALRTLELTVRRRLDGLLQGNHLGLVPGPGTEPGDARPYYPGDDVRRMDWSVTARTTEPHIRQTVADRELETWLVADLSASLDFGTTGCEKRDLVVAAAAAVGHLTSGGGNRIGAVVSTGASTTRIPARGGRPHLQHLLRALAQTPRSGPADRAGEPHDPAAERGDLATAMEQLRRPPRRRGLAVVMSDFIGPVTWERSLRALSRRHDLLAIEVLDPRDVELPAVGLVTLVDPETGRSQEVSTTAKLRAAFATAAAGHRAQVADALRRAGAAQLVLRTDRDWVADVMRFVMSRKRGWTGASPRGAQPVAATAGEAGELVNFAQPVWLAAGVLVLALGIGYLIAQRRTRRHTMRFANLELLDSVAPKRPGRWRHLPTALVLVGLVLLTVALAGPTADTKEPRNRATVMLAIDVSLSMEATDVAPNRLAAAQDAATQFVDDLTPGVNLGIVSFAGIATVLVRPTTDRAAAKQAIAGLTLDERTATGEAIMSCLQTIDLFSKTISGVDPSAGPPPARIVLMTDGKRTVGRTEQDAAQRAADAKVPVSVIAFGTDNGSITVDGQQSTCRSTRRPCSRSPRSPAATSTPPPPRRN